MNKTILISSILLTASFSSCVNNLEVINPENPEGKIPISLSAQILEIRPTRLAGNNFDNADEMGLYVLAQPNTLEQTRHIDNAKVTYQDGMLSPGETLYYPYGNPLCDFISYYPFQENGIPEMSSEIGIETYADQSTAENYSKSDFLVAKAEGVVPGNGIVNLQYHHKLSQLNISIRLSGDDDINEVAQNTAVTIENIQTKAQYNLTTGQFVSFSTPTVTTTNGQWEVSEETKTISGMKAIVIPQPTTGVKITLHMNGRTFSSPLPESFKLLSGNSYNLILNFDSKVGIGSMAASIADWTNGGDTEIDMEEEINETAVSVASLNFSQYGIYNLLNEEGAVVGTVCQEYLLNDNIDAQAIVLYPASSPMEGTVLQIKGENGAVHGGQISWNQVSNSFTYQAGTSQPVTAIYLDENNNVVTEMPENAQILKAEQEVLRDQRGAEVNYYAVVKIGCQYFTKENLKTTYYNDGTPISDHTNDTNNPSAGYYMNEGTYFYNLGTLKTQKMAPQGWKIPTEQEWNVMKTYIRDNASVLKSTTEWKAFDGIAPGNNLTGFSGYPRGMYFYNEEDKVCEFLYTGEYTAFWNGDAEIGSNAFLGLAFKFDATKTNQTNAYSGYNIRLLKVQ